MDFKFRVIYINLTQFTNKHNLVLIMNTCIYIEINITFLYKRKKSGYSCTCSISQHCSYYYSPIS